MKVKGIEIPQAAIDAVNAYIGRNDGFTLDEIARVIRDTGWEFGASYDAAERLLRAMRKAGRITFQGKKWWRV